MDLNELLLDLFDRVAEHVERVVAGLDTPALCAFPEPGANPIGWLVWHLTRVQDHYIAEMLDEPQVWITGGWALRFGLAADPRNTGYGHTPADVAAVRPDGPDALTGYYTAVAERTRRFLQRVSPAELDRIVDRRWTPPVTLGARLVSIADDDLQHAGQAAYVRGILERR